MIQGTEDRFSDENHGKKFHFMLQLPGAEKQERQVRDEEI